MNQLRTRLLLEEDRQKEREKIDQFVHAVDSVAAEYEHGSSTTSPITLAGPSVWYSTPYVCSRRLRSVLLTAFLIKTRRNSSDFEDIFFYVSRVKVHLKHNNKIFSFSKTCSHIPVKAVTSSVFCFQLLVLKHDSSFLALHISITAAFPYNHGSHITVRSVFG